MGWTKFGVFFCFKERVFRHVRFRSRRWQRRCARRLRQWRNCRKSPTTCRKGGELRHRRLEGVSEAFCFGVWSLLHYYSPRETCVSVGAMAVVAGVAVGAREAMTRRAGAAVTQEAVGRDVLRRLVMEGEELIGDDDDGDDDGDDKNSHHGDDGDDDENSDDKNSHHGDENGHRSIGQPISEPIDHTMNNTNDNQSIDEPINAMDTKPINTINTIDNQPINTTNPFPAAAPLLLSLLADNNLRSQRSA